MSISKEIALAQIDAVFKRRSELGSNWVSENIQEITTLSCAVIDRLAGPGSVYREDKERAFAKTLKSLGRSREEEIEFRLRGILSALRSDYENGYLQTYEELVHANLFSDFLEMATYLLSEGYKDAAAVISGSVLEENIRKLCQKNGVVIMDSKGAPKKASAMNDDLAKAGVYGKLEQKSITAWLDLRNKAAHGDFSSYDVKQVDIYMQGIRDFLMRHPA